MRKSSPRPRHRLSELLTLSAFLGCYNRSWASADGTAGTSVAIHVGSGTCADPRYPSLAGPWIIGCDETGRITDALSVETGQVITLPEPMDSPGLSPNQVFDTAVGIVSLPSGDVTPSRAFHRHRWQQQTAPPANRGQTVAITTASSVDTTKLGTGIIRRFGPEAEAPTPLGWYPAAINQTHIAWVVDGGSSGADVWWVARAKGRPEPLASGPGQQHHIVGSDAWLAWVEPSAVVVLDTLSGQETRHPAKTGFSAGITLWQDVVCWETRQDADIDIECSDGVIVRGSGHQRWPSRWGNYLLYRDGDQVMLWTRSESEDTTNPEAVQ